MALVEVTRQGKQDNAASPVQGSPVLVPVLCLGGCSPSIFITDINFHPFQYFMSVTIKGKKNKGDSELVET